LSLQFNTYHISDEGGSGGGDYDTAGRERQIQLAKIAIKDRKIAGMECQDAAVEAGMSKSRKILLSAYSARII
jgi:hypothetical protein